MNATSTTLIDGGAYAGAVTAYAVQLGITTTVKPGRKWLELEFGYRGKQCRRIAKAREIADAAGYESEAATALLGSVTEALGVDDLRDNSELRSIR